MPAFPRKEVGAAGSMPAEQKALDDFLGKWKTTYTNLKAEWTPEEKSGSAILVYRRVLGGRFVQEQAEHEDKASNMAMYTHDEQQRCYRTVWFGSNGQANDSTGTWDAGTGTFTWTAKGVPPVATSFHRFMNGDAMEWGVLTKNDQGATLLQVEGKAAKK